MTRAEQWLMAKVITRYFKDVQNKDVMKKRLLPLVKDFAGKQTKKILCDIRSLLIDWMGEIDEFLETL